MDRENKIEIDVQLEVLDLLRANYWILFRRFKFFFIFVTVALLSPLLYPLLSGTKQSNGIYWWLIFPIGFIVLPLAITYIGSKRQFSSNESLNQVSHYTFSYEGIEISTATAYAKAKWNNNFEVYETKQNFYMYPQKNIFYIIPKRCFRDDAQINWFRELIVSALASNAKVYSR